MITRRTIAISTLEVILKQVLAILTIMILARFLSPSDYGAVVPVYLISTIVSGLVDFGIGSAVVRFRGIGHEGESTAFWMNLGSACILCTIAVISAPKFSWYFNNEGLKYYIWIASAAILINSIGAIQQNILLRDKKFQTLFWVGVLPQLTSSVCVILMAYSGFGPWALIFQILVSSIVSTVICWWLGGWRPLFVFKVEVFNRLVGFGFFLSLSGIVNAIYKNSSATLILKGAGESAAGNYYAVDRLQQYASDFMVNISSRLAFSSFIGLSEKNDQAKIFSYGLILISFVSTPVFLGIFSIPDLIIWVILGDKWVDNSDTLRALSIVGFFWPLEVHNQNLIKAVGSLQTYFKVELAKRLAGICVIAFAAFKAPSSIPLVVASLAFVFYLANACYAEMLIDRGLFKQLQGLFPGLISGMAMMGSVLSARMISYPNQLLELCVSILVGAATYALASFYLNRIMFIQTKNFLMLIMLRMNLVKNDNAN